MNSQGEENSIVELAEWQQRFAGFLVTRVTLEDDLSEATIAEVKHWALGVEAELRGTGVEPEIAAVRFHRGDYDELLGIGEHDPNGAADPKRGNDG